MQSFDGYGGTSAAVGDIDMVDNSSTEGAMVASTSGTFPLGASAGGANGASGAYLPGLTSVPAAIEAWVTVGGDDDFNQLRAALDATNRFALSVFNSSISVFYSNSTTNRTVDTGGTLVSLSGRIAPGSRHVAAYVSGTNLYVYVDAVLYGTVALVAGTYSLTLSMFQPGVNVNSRSAETPVSHFAVYSSALTATQVSVHYDAGLHAFGHPYGDRAGARIGRILDAIDWPSADRDLSTGSTVLGQWLPTGNALDACRATETVEQGAFFISAAGKPTLRSRNDFRVLTRCTTSQATFGDDPAETPIDNPLTIDGNHIDYLRNLVTVTYAGGSVTAQDTTSRTAYGDLDDTVTATLLPAADGWTARQLANYRLRLRKTPISRVSTVTPQVLASDTVMATLIPLELCDRVTVNRRPTGGSGSFSQACHLQGIRSSWTPQAGHKWQGYLAPAIPSAVTAGYMIVGDATYGITGSTVTSY
jgi:hypothetical protein